MLYYLPLVFVCLLGCVCKLWFGCYLRCHLLLFSLKKIACSVLTLVAYIHVPPFIGWYCSIETAWFIVCSFWRDWLIAIESCRSLIFPRFVLYTCSLTPPVILPQGSVILHHPCSMFRYTLSNAWLAFSRWYYAQVWLAMHWLCFLDTISADNVDSAGHPDLHNWSFTMTSVFEVAYMLYGCPETTVAIYWPFCWIYRLSMACLALTILAGPAKY